MQPRARRSSAVPTRGGPNGQPVRSARRPAAASAALAKCPTGIRGLDEITAGGLPRGRPTLVCGSAGCGKTLLAMEFIIRGIAEYGEPGVIMSFEETEPELAANVRSLGFDLPGLVARRKLALDFVRVERTEIEETGEYDLEGLFVRLQDAIDTVAAKRVVLDTIESLFSGLSNTAILRGELRRLFRWLKEKGVTALITGERGDGTLTRQGIEEYVSDCVILLDHRIADQISTRRLRVVKYRGSTHGTNEYPFIITERGISVLPVTSLELQHTASTERVSTGVVGLDAMLDGAGCYRGSTILVSGTAGTGKTSLAAHFVAAACRRGEKCLYLAFEEAQSQLARNMRSIGIDLRPYLQNGRLLVHASRPTRWGLEMHLVSLHRLVEDHQPRIVVIDPATNFISAGNALDVHTMLMRMVDYLKAGGVTTMITTLTAAGDALEHTAVNISSLVDTWILLRDIECAGERNRGLHVLKSRGMAHSNQIREYRLTRHGMELLQVYVGPGGVLTGSARLAQEARERAEEVVRAQDVRRQAASLLAERRALEAQIAALQARLVAQEKDAVVQATEEHARLSVAVSNRAAMAHSRHTDLPARHGKSGSPSRRRTPS